ncbi:MAG: asparagine synthase C-terminal domain-containing protein [Oscillospiraceae bacterium]|nr:asparagine synthase C-terminal domain-containing protein [Oscillospiraceae bacterium]
MNRQFYCENNGKTYYADTIAELLEISKIKPCLDIEGVAAITLMGPGRPVSSGIFKGVKQTLPHKPLAKEHTEAFEETSAHIRELLTKSIESNLDLNPCLFLSGGLDSSIIGTVAARKIKELMTYSVDYKDNNINFKAGEFQPTEDTPFIKEMCDFLECSHRQIILDTDMLYNALIPAITARGLPGMADVDSSLYLFCQEVAKMERKPDEVGQATTGSVALSGEGADELFGGYKWYFDETLLTSTTKQACLPWVRSVPERADLLRKDILNKINPQEYINYAYREIIDNVSYLDTDDELTRKRREMFCLNYYGFMQTLMERSERMSQVHGLKILTPFYTRQIVEYAYNIPWEMKAYQGREKGLLRHAFNELLPESVAWRKKSPFPKTHNPEYMKRVSERLSEVINKPYCRVTEIYDKKKLFDLIQTEGGNFKKNWFGQLMTVPQIMAYIIQLEHWLSEYDVTLV